MDDLLYFDFNQKSSVLLIFFFNAVVFSVLLLKKGITKHKPDSNWLASFIFLGGLYLCPFMLGYAGWYGQKSYREFLFFIPFQQLFLIGPVFFYYVKTLLNINYKFIPKDVLHFLPAILYFIYSLVVFVSDKLVLDTFYFYADGRDKDLDFWYQMAGLISMLFYLFLSLKHYFNYRKLSLQEVSFADAIAFRWVQHFAIAFGCILVLRVLFFVINPEWGEFGSKYWYYLCFAILLMYITVSGYSNTIKSTVSFITSPIGDLELTENEQETESESKERIILVQWKEKIMHLFEVEEIYKHPDLTLTNIAVLLNTNRNVISKVINQEFRMNFNDFVNEKRTKAVIEKLKNGEHLKCTLLSIAFDCGFNSKTTFNRAFKKYTNLTPKQYITKINFK